MNELGDNPTLTVTAALDEFLRHPDVAASPDVSFVGPAVDFRVTVSSLLSRIPE
jgi:hypothetical protein